MIVFSGKFKDHDVPEPRPDGAVPFFVDRCGTGDVLMVLGVVLGLRAKETPAYLVGTRADHADVLSLFGEPLVPGADGAWEVGGASVFHNGYLKARREKAVFTSYVRNICETVAPDDPPVWVAPTPLAVSPENAEFAEAVWAQLGDKGPRVYVAPFAAYGTREWPLSHWVDLVWGLHDRGCRVLAGLHANDKDACSSFVKSLWGHPWNQIAAVIASADLVVSNDTGPAHLAGCLKRPTLVVCGPTEGLYEQYETVAEVSARPEEYQCVGCWFSRPGGFRRSCDHMCRALAGVDPEGVMELAEEVLRAGSVPERLLRPGGLHQPGSPTGPVAYVPGEVDRARFPQVRRAVLRVRRVGAR